MSALEQLTTLVKEGYTVHISATLSQFFVVKILDPLGNIVATGRQPALGEAMSDAYTETPENAALDSLLGAANG